MDFSNPAIVTAWAGIIFVALLVLAIPSLIGRRTVLRALHAAEEARGTKVPWATRRRWLAILREGISHRHIYGLRAYEDRMRTMAEQISPLSGVREVTAAELADEALADAA